MLHAMWRVFRALYKTVGVLALSILLVPLAMGGTALGIALFTPVPIRLPKARSLPPIRPSYVFDQSGRQLATFKIFDSNIPVTKDDIPKVLKQAVVSAEDRNFWTHNGVDPCGMLRAAVRDLQSKEVQQGGSTITMQYVKAVFDLNEEVDAATGKTDQTALDRRTQTLNRKLTQAVYANRLDRKLKKEDILFGYLTNIFYGNGAYGIGAAAQTYFHKPVRDLTMSESATLAGLIPAPTQYEPRNHTRNAEIKRKATLRAMFDEGYITKAQLDDGLEQELWVETRGPVPAGKRVTLVFVPPKSVTFEPYYVDFVRRYVTAKYGENVVYRRGLRIETTIDVALQRKAEAATQKVLKGTNEKLEMSIVAIEPQTGFVRALVGGRDFDKDQANLALGKCPSPAAFAERFGRQPKISAPCNNFNYIDGGGSGRSPGSSFKPVVLAAAFEEGYTPNFVVSGALFRAKGCGGTKCTIRNYEGAAYGPVTLRQATIKSVNTAYARLATEFVGLEKVAKMAQRLGITSAWYDTKVHGASYALGGIDVSPLEMAAAYSVFANRGRRLPVTPVLRITDADGRVLEDNSDPGTREEQVIPENVADNVTNVLQGVVNEGTGKRAALSGRPAAGKTGTSQDYGNAWFVGYTPDLVASVWIGYKDRPRSLRNIRGVGRVAGGTLPAQTWHNFMTAALENVPVSAFPDPAPIKGKVRRNTAAELARRARRGIDLPRPAKPQNTELKSYVEGIAPPGAVAPVDTVAAPIQAGDGTGAVPPTVVPATVVAPPLETSVPVPPTVEVAPGLPSATVLPAPG